MRDWRTEVGRRLETAHLDGPREHEIAEEIAQHLEDRQAELLARGARSEAAENAVMAELEEGGDLARELQGAVTPGAEPFVPGGPPFGFLGDAWRDLRYAVRQLARNRTFTIVTVLSLALGTGANTAVFQLLDAVFLRALPLDHTEELATVQIHDRHWASGNFNGWHPDLSNPLWEQIRDQQQAFSSIAAWGDRELNLNPGGEAHRARAMLVSGAFFETLRVRPILGRVLGPADDVRGCGEAGAVASYAFWQRELGGRPDAIGRQITLDGHPVQIVGVTPASFFGLEVGRQFDVAIPICFDGVLLGAKSKLDVRYAWWLSAIGRLKPGWSVERASAHLAAISPGIVEATVPPTYPADSAAKYREYRLDAAAAATGISRLRKEYSTPLYFLFGLAGLVLLIACVNLANLLLARASARGREIAVRLALGASRGRLVRQLMTESLLIAVLGAAAGLLMARWLNDLLLASLTDRPNTLFLNLDVDWRVLGFTIGLAIFTCLLFGLAPALRASRGDVGLVLKATGGGASGHGGRFGLRSLLVSVQVALSFVLLVGALLFARSLGKLTGVDPGFRGEGVLTFEADVRSLDLPKERRNDFAAELLERVRGIPGVASAATAYIVPLSGSGWNDDTWVDGSEGKNKTDTYFNRVSPGYFQTMDMRLIAGRDFAPADTLEAPKVVIVSDLWVKKQGLKDPLGKRLRVEATPGGEGEQVFEIVGVARSTKYYELREELTSQAYVPLAQDHDPAPYVQMVVRSSLPPAQLVSAIKGTITDVSPAIVIDFERLEEMARRSVVRERLMATLAGFFGLLAALLACVGLYGVVSYNVARRVKEIGIRMALGAHAGRVVRMIILEAGRLFAIGLAVGFGLALIAAKIAGSLLFGLPPWDPLTFALAILLMTLVAALASLLPARRAARVDPMVALRDE